MISAHNRKPTAQEKGAWLLEVFIRGRGWGGAFFLARFWCGVMEWDILWGVKGFVLYKLAFSWVGGSGRCGLSSKT